MKHGDDVADLEVLTVFLTFLKVRRGKKKQKKTFFIIVPPPKKKRSVCRQAVGSFTVPTSAS